MTIGATKFGRSYVLEVEGRSSTDAAPILLSFNSPLTLEFSIVHNIFASANVADFSIYNLSAYGRSEVSFNQFSKIRSYSVKLRAGYVSQQPNGLLGAPSSLPLIFTGYANVAFTERSGGDLITRINAFDNGDLTNGKPAAIFPKGFNVAAGTKFKDKVLQVMACLKPNVQPGFVQVTVTPEIADVGVRGYWPNGLVWAELQLLAREAPGTHVFIENNVCNMLGQLDTQGLNNLGVLTSATGLLGIPRYSNATVTCRCVFEPALAIGKTINLQSSYSPAPNGPYKIVAYTHSGTISGVRSGEAISEITLMSLHTPLGNPS